MDRAQPTVYSIRLDKEHTLTHLIMKDCHEDVIHNGVKETFTHFRLKYLIIRGRSLVRKLLHGCIVGHKFEGKPFSPLPPPPLPEFLV